MIKKGAFHTITWVPNAPPTVTPTFHKVINYKSGPIPLSCLPESNASVAVPVPVEMVLEPVIPYTLKAGGSLPQDIYKYSFVSDDNNTIKDLTIIDADGIGSKHYKVDLTVYNNIAKRNYPLESAPGPGANIWERSQSVVYSRVRTFEGAIPVEKTVLFTNI